ncbi:MAG: hypothetical protein JKY09_07725 [Crocinitomicaceae bacterium]|nr:hypothetical protein [Crocinitomicaceae bacterium]
MIALIPSCYEWILLQKEDSTVLEHQIEEETHNLTKGNHETPVIDDCQYILYKEETGINLGYGYMSHKGNCNNPTHCYEVSEMVSKEDRAAFEHQIEQKTLNITQDKYKIIAADGCQYILYNEEAGINLGYRYMSHKGNCNNPIHCYKASGIVSDTLDTADTTAYDNDRKENAKYADLG